MLLSNTKWKAFFNWINLNSFGLHFLLFTKAAQQISCFKAFWVWRSWWSFSLVSSRLIPLIIPQLERFYNFLHCWQAGHWLRPGRSWGQWLPSFAWKALHISRAWVALQLTSAVSAMHQQVATEQQQGSSLRAGSELPTKRGHYCLGWVNNFPALKPTSWFLLLHTIDL